MKKRTVIKLENQSSTIELVSPGIDPVAKQPFIYLSVGKWEDENGGCDGEGIELSISEVDELIMALEKIKALAVSENA
jgi:hypothetical protein